MYNDMMDTIGLVEKADPELAAAMNRELTRQRENIVVHTIYQMCIRDRPRETPEQQARKAAVLAEALDGACAVPLDIMDACCEGIRLAADYASTLPFSA